MTLMLLSLFACAVCGAPGPESLSLCRICRESLVSCPPLCSGCGGPLCGDTCRRLWAPLAPMRSLHAAYLFLGLGHEVLKAWKFKSGPLLDRAVLKMEDGLKERLGLLGVQAVIPVPQRYDREWELKGGSARRIAAWLSRELGVPLVCALEAGPTRTRQSGKTAEERYKNAPRFRAILTSPSWLEKSSPVLLVDDFTTTGHTLRSAARALSAGGWNEIHSFCLGLKLRRLEKQSRDLSQSTGWAVAVGEE
jgi:predicted amidophosphoribosyltransferase